VKDDEDQLYDFNTKSVERTIPFTLSFFPDISSFLVLVLKDLVEVKHLVVHH
jgi:hypothetical protein